MKDVCRDLAARRTARSSGCSTRFRPCRRAACSCGSLTTPSRSARPVPPRIASGYVDNFNTWSDMSFLLAARDLAGGRAPQLHRLPLRAVSGRRRDSAVHRSRRSPPARRARLRAGRRALAATTTRRHSGRGPALAGRLRLVASLRPPGRSGEARLDVAVPARQHRPERALRRCRFPAPRSSACGPASRASTICS